MSKELQIKQAGRRQMPPMPPWSGHLSCQQTCDRGRKSARYSRPHLYIGRTRISRLPRDKEGSVVPRANTCRRSSLPRGCEKELGSGVYAENGSRVARGKEEYQRLRRRASR